MAQTKWGILGTAAIAVERVIPAMSQTGSAVAHAIASRDLGKAQHWARHFGISAAYGSYQDLLDDPEVDAVYIPLPNHLHVEWATRALDAGKHVLCEKPLCLTSAEARQLIHAQSRAGRYIEEGLAFRNHPQWDRVDQLIEQGTIGEPVAVHGTIAKRFLDPNDIRNNPALGGGALYDLGVYVLSACNIIFRRPPRWVTGTINRDPEFGVDRLTSVILDYGEAHATFTAASQAGTSAWATHQQFSVLGSHGWLRLSFPYAHARPIKSRLEFGDQTSVGSVPTAVEMFPPINQYALQLERFSRFVQGEPVRAWPLEDTLTSITAIECIFRAAETKSWVELVGGGGDIKTGHTGNRIVGR